ncbi:MAG TPA: hypothetical protein V6D18_20765 [Thermosynechococcaceae cyanobacterium]
MLYLDHVMGAAVFDLNGLPREYFTTEGTDMSWVQTIFQALGLRSLLISSLQLEGFHHAIVHGSESCAVVVKQRTHYTALLIRQSEQEIDRDFLHWLQNLQLSELRQSDRFRVA